MTASKLKKIKKNTFVTCLPLVAPTLKEARRELAALCALEADFVEWRRDYLRSNDPGYEASLLAKLPSAGPGLIYTFRAEAEGGARAAKDSGRLAAIQRAVATGRVSYVDVELGSEAVFRAEVGRCLAGTGTDLILSNHDFGATPSVERILETLAAMEDAGADVLKVAYQPQSAEDVKALAQAGNIYGRGSDKPLILIAMGSLGQSSRIFPELFGGSLTFAQGLAGSAPGQPTLAEISAFREALGFGGPRRSIALIGFMGTGKSTIGRRLAKQLGYTFYDTDRVIEDAAGKTISEIFAEDGEAHFRQWEKEVLAQLAASEGNVIATGGGIVLDPENRRLLTDNTYVVTLAAHPEAIHQRTSRRSNRPLLAQEDPRAHIRRMLAEREEYYTIGDLRLRTDRLSVKKAVARIEREYKKAKGKSKGSC